MNPSESPLLDDDAMQVLSAGYLLRPRTRAELRACLTEEPPLFDEIVDALAAAGFIDKDGDSLAFSSPYATFVALGRARAERITEESARTVAMMDALPSLMRAWDLSEGRRPISGHTIDADPDGWQAWFDYVDAESPVRPAVVFTDECVLDAALRSGHLFRLHQRSLDAGAPGLRILVPLEQTWGPRRERLIEEATELGIHLRRSTRAVSWWYVDEGGLVGLPMVWRSGSPTRAMVVRTPPVVAGFAQLFDQLWSGAHPVRAATSEWEPILTLMAQGATDDAIARALGLASRTVRRRVADAMEDLGATSRFTLGAAWQARNAPLLRSSPLMASHLRPRGRTPDPGARR